MSPSSPPEANIKHWLANRKLILFLVILLLIGLNVLVYTRVSYLFIPIQVLLKTIMLPILLTGVVYYLLNPIVDLLERYRIRRIYSILLLYIIIIGIFTLFIVAIAPFIGQQAIGLIENLPLYGQQIQQLFNDLVATGYLDELQQFVPLNLPELVQNVTERAYAIMAGAMSSIGNVFDTVKELVLAIITLPFILFYLLKDGRRLPHYFARFIPTHLRERSLKVMSEMNGQISSYIRGQIIVSFCIGCLLYIGFLIIGLDYALALALIAACTSIVPYLGPAIAITPALIVAIVTSPIMLLKLIVIWTVVQLIEGKFISPQIMGKNLQIHPITIIFVILTAGNLFGIVGIIVAVPGYAVLKVIVSHLFEWFKRRSALYS